MHPYLNIAVKAARRAGTLITRHIDQIDTLKVFEKGLNDWVTAVDKAVEEDIIETIRKAYPNHAILGEETGSHPGQEYEWIIDPLDGTLNYVHGFPQFAVSIGIRFKDQIEHAVIYDPLSHDLYTATRGRGAQLNDKRIRVSTRNDLAGSLIGSAFPYRNLKMPIDEYLKITKALFTHNADVRQTGSAALNLAYIAAGRLDGFWETGLKPWDMAAGSLLIREAGGYISDFKNENGFSQSGNIVAGNRKVQVALLKLLQEQANLNF